ncbi:MAG TPA: class I SAM-dependent methyltransferase [Candidatus Krumholzibacteria bacterium]
MTASQRLEVSAAARHDAMVAAYDAQRARLAPDRSDAWAGCAQFFKADPRRELDALLSKIASYLRPDDTLLDVGGGAGRMSLPLSFHCREVIVIDPSSAMEETFQATAKEAGIANARFLRRDWLEGGDVEGDVALVAHVTYFIPKVVPFIEKLNAAARRRVVVNVRTVPPPNQASELFRMARGEELMLVPGPEELLAVLSEMGVAADLIDVGPALLPATAPAGKTREDAIRIEVDGAVRGGWLKEEEKERLGAMIEQRFDELLAKTPEGFRRRIALHARDLLITWETESA